MQEMLVDRGYTLLPGDWSKWTEATFLQHATANPFVLTASRDKQETITRHIEGNLPVEVIHQTTESIVAYFDVVSAKNFDVVQLRELTSFMEIHGMNRAVLVSDLGPNPFVTKLLPVHHDKGFSIQTWQCMQLYRNLTHHEMCPAHRLLSTEEAQLQARNQKSKADNFPEFKSIDWVVCYYDYPTHAMVEISRHPGGSIQPHLFYRVTQ